MKESAIHFLIYRLQHREFNRIAWADPCVALKQTGVPAHEHARRSKTSLIADRALLGCNVWDLSGYEVMVIRGKSLLRRLTFLARREDAVFLEA
jgi:hypothetical protein